MELSILSAMAHGNGPSGLDVVVAALSALERLDREHAMVYFQIIYGALREPMKRALEARVMQQQKVPSDIHIEFTEIFQRVIDEHELKAGLKGKREGKLEARREVLLRLVGRVGIALSESDANRIHTCEDAATLDRWVDNVLGAKTAAELFA